MKKCTEEYNCDLNCTEVLQLSRCHLPSGYVLPNKWEWYPLGVQLDSPSGAEET